MRTFTTEVPRQVSREKQLDRGHSILQHWQRESSKDVYLYIYLHVLILIVLILTVVLIVLFF